MSFSSCLKGFSVESAHTFWWIDRRMWLAHSAVQNCPCKDMRATTQSFLGLKIRHQFYPKFTLLSLWLRDPRRAFPAPCSGWLLCPAWHKDIVTRQRWLKAQRELSLPTRTTKHPQYDHLALEQIQSFLLQASVLRLTKWLFQCIPTADKVWYCSLRSAEHKQDTAWPAQKLSDCQMAVSRSVLLPPETEIT